MTERREIAKRHQHERWAGMLEEAPGKRELDGRLQRNIEQQERLATEGTGCFPRGLEKRRAIRRRRSIELRIEPFEQRREIGASERQPAQGVRANPGERQLIQRSRQRTRKPRRRRHRREVLEFAVVPGLERRSRRDRLGSDPRHRHCPARRQHRCSDVRRQLREAESVQADRPAPGLRDRPGEVVCGATRCRCDDGAISGMREQPLVRGLDPERGFGGFDDAKLEFRRERHTGHLPGRHAG